MSILLWQQHGTAPTPHTPAACPNGPTNCHAHLLSPQRPLSRPVFTGFFLSFTLLATLWHVTHSPHPNAPQCPNRLPRAFTTTSSLTLPTWKVQQSASMSRQRRQSALAPSDDAARAWKHFFASSTLATHSPNFPLHDPAHPIDQEAPKGFSGRSEP